MSKKPANSGKPWTAQDIKELKNLVKKNTPTRVIGIKLERSEDAIRTKASVGRHFTQTNQPISIWDTKGIILNGQMKNLVSSS